MIHQMSPLNNPTGILSLQWRRMIVANDRILDYFFNSLSKYRTSLSITETSSLVWPFVRWIHRWLVDHKIWPVMRWAVLFQNVIMVPLDEMHPPQVFITHILIYVVSVIILVYNRRQVFEFNIPTKCYFLDSGHFQGSVYATHRKQFIMRTDSCDAAEMNSEIISFVLTLAGVPGLVWSVYYWKWWHIVSCRNKFLSFSQNQDQYEYIRV